MTVLVNNRCLHLCLQKYQPRNSILQQLYNNFIEAQKLGPNKQGNDLLLHARVKVFEFLKSKMQCSLGVNDSALASINALLKENSMISEKFSQECVWTFKCSSCGYTQVDRHTKLVVTFPNTTDDFTMPSGVFERACYKCKATGGRSQLELKRLPPCVMAHFVEGVKNKDFLKNGFVCQGKEYELCQLIQYKKNPDHFIAWIRNGNGTHWAKVDDTKNVVCKWRKGHPSFPLDQLHIAVWQRAKIYQRKSLSVESVATALAETKILESRVVKASSTVGLSEYLNDKLSLASLKDNRLLKNIGLSSSSSKDTWLRELSPQSNVLSSNVKMRGETNDVLPDSGKSLELEEGSGQKRKNTFEPYIPKKKRTSSTGISLSKDEEKTGTILENIRSPILANENKLTDASTSISHWKAMSRIGNDKQGVICDNQSDSGYSSPGSNGSCVSLPSNHCTKEENLILNEIIDTLDEIDIPQKKSDSLGLKSSLAVARGKTDLVGSLGHSNLSSVKKDTSFTNDLELSEYISKTNLDSCANLAAIKGMSSSDDGRDKLDSARRLEPCDFADIETVSNCGIDIMDEIDFLENMDLLNGATMEDSKTVTSREKNSSLKSVTSNEDNSVLSSSELNCVFEPLNLPELSAFMALELEMNKNSSTGHNFSCEDILEEIFPSKLLDKETCEQSSTSEFIDITEQTRV
ncbi:SUMO-specific isopeptidase USPL1-like [Paramuricea clavata]|nr:SUMO-specific isopeptidase USPL1-like [Paramuricea clavata]